MQWGDWLGLSLEALPVLGIAAAFFYGVWIDIVEPWWADKHAEARTRRILQAKGLDPS